jgi:hypothetical protein
MTRPALANNLHAQVGLVVSNCTERYIEIAQHKRPPSPPPWCDDRLFKPPLTINPRGVKTLWSLLASVCDYYQWWCWICSRWGPAGLHIGGEGCLATSCQQFSPAFWQSNTGSLQVVSQPPTLSNGGYGIRLSLFFAYASW